MRRLLCKVLCDILVLEDLLGGVVWLSVGFDKFVSLVFLELLKEGFDILIWGLGYEFGIGCICVVLCLFIGGWVMFFIGGVFEEVWGGKLGWVIGGILGIVGGLGGRFVGCCIWEFKYDGWGVVVGVLLNGIC